MTGHKTFISYKYADTNVKQLTPYSISSVRGYVDDLYEKLIVTPHIYKAEEDGNDLSRFKDATIQSHLKDKIYDSSVTIIMISQGMKDVFKAEKDQWIPWEIEYSLRNTSRNDWQSKSNGLLAVVLPDRFGSYEYAIKDNPNCNSRTIMTNSFFEIIGNNMFNRRAEDSYLCNGSTFHRGESSYISVVKWEDFTISSTSISSHINKAYDRSLIIDNYIIQNK